MYSLSSSLFWMNAVYFFLAGTLAFFIPGHLCIKKLKLDLFSEIVISIVTGFVFWSLLGFSLGFLHMRNLMYLYILISLIFWIKQKNYSVFKQRFPLKIDIGIAAIICIGTLVQLASIWMSGIQIKNGLYFCCGIPDTVTHLALTNELVNRFPPNEPGFSNIPLFNYHYLSNLGVADLIRIFRLPLIPTQYQYMTMLFSFLFGFTAITLAKTLRLSKKFLYWFLFFLYFFGDILFFLPLLSGHGMQFSYTTLENASTLWVSPPRFFSLVILITGLTLFVQWIKKKDMYTGIIMAIVLGSLIGFKVYIGMFLLSGFAFLALYYLATKKYVYTIPILFCFFLSGILWILVNKDAGGMVFTGFWRFEDFIVQPALGLSHLELARRIFLDHNNIARALLYDILFACLYIFFSSGTLLLGFFQTKQSLEKIPKELTIVLITGLISTCIAGFFFLQETGGANTSQFLISISIVGAIYTSLAISWWTRKGFSLFLILLCSAIVLLTSTRVIYNTYTNGQKMITTTGTFVSLNVWDAYRYIATTQKESIVLLYDDSTMDCLFITFIGNRPTFLCTSGMPGVIDNETLAKRNKAKQIIFFEKDTAYVKQELSANNISYIFISKDKVKETILENLHLPIVYETDDIVIYKILKHE